MGMAIGYISAAIQLGSQAIAVKPKRSIGGFVAHVTMREVHHDDLEITDHPVEQGAAITDHAFMRPSEVIIECVWSNSPQNKNLVSGLLGAVSGTIAGVSALFTGNSPDQAKAVYQKLLALQASRIPFDVLTAKRAYKDMVIKSLQTETDGETANVLKCTLHCRQVLIAQIQVVSVAAPQANQLAPQSTMPTAVKGLKQLADGAKANLASAIDSLTPDPAKLITQRLLP